MKISPGFTFLFNGLLVFIAILPESLFAQSSLIECRGSFVNPPAEYRPMPFWHLNGKLNTKEINEQVTVAADSSGFGGITLLPVTAHKQYRTNLPSPGMDPKYFTEDYFDRYGDILKAAKKDGIHVILYDDVDFPSGTFGGKMSKLYPDDVRKRLDRNDTLINGPQLFAEKLPEGILMAAVAINKKTKERIDITESAKTGILLWNVPEGEWNIEIFNCALHKGGVVDYMDPKAVDKFIALSYDEYYKRFSSYFGTTIQKTFYDDVGYVNGERSWTNKFNEKFMERTGKPASTYYPALWEDIGPETEAARIALFDTRAELFSEGFPRQIAEWDAKHGIKSMGHPPGSYEIQPTDMSCDVFKFYRHEDIPTLDAIFYHGHGREGFKLASSAGNVYDRPVVGAEIYGAFWEEKTDSNTLYRAAMEVFARGVNFLVPHGMWYDYSDQAVRIPPLISYYSPKIGPALPAYNAFVGRSCMMLQGGSTVTDIAVFYPIASLEGWFRFEANKGWGKYAAPETDYLKLSDMLTNQVHRDFTFLHPEMFLTAQYEVKGNSIVLKNKVNAQNYKVLIIPGGKVISYKALQKIKTFYDNGGKLIATSMLPSKSAEFGHDKDVVNLIKSMFEIDPLAPVKDETSAIHTNANGGKLVFIGKPNAIELGEVLNQMAITPDVKFTDNVQPTSDSGAFSYIHKVKDGKDIYFFANSSSDNINTSVELRGNLKPEMWDPHTGKITQIKDVQHFHKDDEVFTRLPLHLPGVKAVFIVEK